MSPFILEDTSVRWDRLVMCTTDDSKGFLIDLIFKTINPFEIVLLLESNDGEGKHETLLFDFSTYATDKGTEKIVHALRKHNIIGVDVKSQEFAARLTEELDKRYMWAVLKS